MSSSSTSSPIPDLWSDQEVEVREDGFLMIKPDVLKDMNALLLEESQQPLLLHSTITLMQALHPTTCTTASVNEILQRPGYVDMQKFPLSPPPSSSSSSSINDDNAVSLEKLSISTTVEEDPDPQALDENNAPSKTAQGIPAKYQCYQHLVPGDNITNRIQSAVLDIEYFRHRLSAKERNKDSNDGGGKSKRFFSKERKKIEALEHQQQRLLRLQSDGTNNGDGGDGATSSTSLTANGDSAAQQDGSGGGDHHNDNDQEEDGAPPSESQRTVRLVRTINSIRALFPHLLGMLNHPLRNDRDLVIGRHKYNARKKRSTCWLIGTEVFATSTNKFCMTTNKDILRLLETLLDAKSARRLWKDWKGKSTTNWKSDWIEGIRKRSRPTIEHPLRLLSVESGKSEQVILERAHQLDELIYARQEACTGSDPLTTKQQQQHYKRAVRKLQQRLSNVLKHRFPGAHINIYGSCLSNLSLGKGSDVDLSLWIPEADHLKKDFRNGTIGANKYERETKRLVFAVFHKLSNLRAEFQGMEAVPHARIPVIKGTWNHAGNPFTDTGSIDFDICFLNNIAVANSGLLGEYTLIDPRARTMMIAVKQFAKERNINSARDGYISSYAWVNMVIFYLQCIGFFPNLQSLLLMEEVGYVKDPSLYWHSVNNLDTTFLTWDKVKSVWTLPAEFEETPVSILIYGFLEFYSRRFPLGTFAISMKRGQIVLPKLAARKVTSFYSIEDPFETYDSHASHDLGTPASENGAIQIVDLIQEAEYHLESILCNDDTGDVDIWPQSLLSTQNHPPPEPIVDTPDEVHVQHRQAVLDLWSSPPPTEHELPNNKGTPKPTAGNNGGNNADASSKAKSHGPIGGLKNHEQQRAPVGIPFDSENTSNNNNDTAMPQEKPKLYDEDKTAVHGGKKEKNAPVKQSDRPKMLGNGGRGGQRQGRSRRGGGGRGRGAGGGQGKAPQPKHANHGPAGPSEAKAIQGQSDNGKASKKPQGRRGRPTKNGQKPKRGDTPATAASANQ